jgi:NitT/TauT family transport system substrate-binding protein
MAIRNVGFAVLAVGVAALSAGSADAKGVRPKLAPVIISGKEVSIIPDLTLALGNFAEEGIDAKLIGENDYPGPDYLMQAALNQGRIDVAVHWFQHVIYGDAHNQPTKAVMVLNNAPGLTIMAANRVKDRVRSPADFKGLKVAEGGGYATKSMIVNLLTARAGLPTGSYTPVFTASEGRQEATLKALTDGDVDVIAFREPQASGILATGQVTTLYRLTDAASTRAVLGDDLPAQSVFTSTKYIEQHPDRVQHVVSAFVRTMRFVNAHTPEQIVARLPDSYFKGTDRATVTRTLAANMSTFAQGRFTFTPTEAKLQQELVDNAPFDDGAEGIWRRESKHVAVAPTDLYTNVFVQRAVKAIRFCAGYLSTDCPARR